MDEDNLQAGLFAELLDAVDELAGEPLQEDLFGLRLVHHHQNL